MSRCQALIYVVSSLITLSGYAQELCDEVVTHVSELAQTHQQAYGEANSCVLGRSDLQISEFQFRYPRCFTNIKVAVYPEYRISRVGKCRQVRLEHNQVVATIDVSRRNKSYCVLGNALLAQNKLRQTHPSCFLSPSRNEVDEEDEFYD